MKTQTPLVLGTHNKKKAFELQLLLEPYGFKLTTLADHSSAIEVVEDGKSFAENAMLKATEQAKHLNAMVVGEDSGICVDALDGAPGIYSARFAGERATDSDNNAHLLRSLQGVPLIKRTAHYVSHICLSDPTGELLVSCEEYCHGRIREQAAGAGGFGYDPLFEILEYHKTFGELGTTVKSLISHRARALRKFVPLLLTKIGERKDCQN